MAALNGILCLLFCVKSKGGFGLVQALFGAGSDSARFWCFGLLVCAILGRFLLISNNKISGLRKKSVNPGRLDGIASGRG